MPAAYPRHENSESIQKLEALLGQFQTPSFIEAAARQAALLPAEVERLITTFANEARRFGPRVAAQLAPRARVLEVGSGLGFLSLWISGMGHDVVAIEPGDGAFSALGRVSQSVASASPGPHPAWVRMKAEDLTPDLVGQFDLIFSLNVLEHISELDRAFSALAALLAPGGVMFHSCPNYQVPYEPHLGIPLIPGMTSLLFPRQLEAHRETWESLNFISAHQVLTMAARRGLNVTFGESELADSLRRLMDDDVFAERHFGQNVGRFRRVLQLAERSGLMAIARRWPAAWSTPMSFVVRHK